MIKIGITGSIATGKTLIESFLVEEEIPAIDADKIVHRLFKSDNNVIKEVLTLFESYGLDIKDEQGNISREKIGKIVFRDKHILRELEKIVHPKVREKIQEFFGQNHDKYLAAAVVPVLFEAGMQDMFDFVIVVIADEDIQIKRLMKRNNFSEEEALLRINAQMPQEEKVKRADFVIDNSYDVENTGLQLKEILRKIQQRC